MPPRKFWEPILDYGRTHSEVRPDVSNREAIRGIMYLQFFMTSNKEFFPGPAQARWCAETILVGGLLHRNG